MAKKIISLVLFLIIALSFSLTACTVKEPSGFIYTMEEAYEREYVTQEDLKKMAYYQYEEDPDFYGNNWRRGGFSDVDFEPLPKMPKSISLDTEEKIKNAYAEDLRKTTSFSKASAEDVTIYGYCGTYSGYVAVMIQDSYHTYNGKLSVPYIGSGVFIALFCDTAKYSYGVFVWKDGVDAEFYDVETAYERGLISGEDTRNIGYYQRDNYENNWRKNMISAPKTPEVLSEATIYKIKKTEWDIFHDSTELTVEDIRIGKYYGTYGDYVAIQGSKGFGLEIVTYVVGDVLLHTNIEIWKENPNYVN